MPKKKPTGQAKDRPADPNVMGLHAQVVEQPKRKWKIVLLAAAAVLLFLVTPMVGLLAAVICLVVFLVKRKKRSKAAEDAPVSNDKKGAGTGGE